MLGHDLEMYSDFYSRGWVGVCDCSSPDWVDDGWEGQVQFYGDSEQEVIDLHHDHLLEVEDAHV